MKKFIIVILIFSNCFYLFSLSAQSVDTTSKLNSKRLTTVIVPLAVAYPTTLYFLNNLWYKDYPRSSFHFFDDNNEWMQIDKVGHLYTSYYIGEYGIKLFKWTGMKRKQAIWYGGLMGTVYLLNIEILDGFSSEWGFSVGDMTVNILGSFAAISQQLAWNESRIVGKFSFHQTSLAKYRPDILGKNIQENMLKDYNGQTYWISCNVYSFLKKDSKFPKWLNVSIGYGCDGMIGATANPKVYNGQVMPKFDRYRQYYLSLDVDLSKIKTKSKFVNTIFQAVNLLKFPAPTLEYNKANGFVFHSLYF